jgi:hypothetical protein
MLMDAAGAPWSDAVFPGRMLRRDQALAHPWRTEVFQIIDHMLVQDPEIKAFLDDTASDHA